MRKFMIIPTVLLAVAASGFAYAQEGHGHHHRPMPPFARELHQLNLSDSQKADIKQLTKASFEQMKPRMQAARQQREAFEALTPDSANYNSAAQALAQTEASNVSARVLQLTSLKQQIYQRLTTEQKQKLADMEAKRQARMAKWKAKHQQKDDGPTEE